MRHTWHVLCATSNAGAVDPVLTGGYFRLRCGRRIVSVQQIF